MKSFIDFITEAAGLKRVDSTHYIHPSGLHLVQKDDKTWSVYHPDPENPSQPDYYGKEQSVKHRNKQSAIRSASMHYRLHMKPAKITEEVKNFHIKKLNISDPSKLHDRGSNGEKYAYRIIEDIHLNDIKKTGFVNPSFLEGKDKLIYFSDWPEAQYAPYHGVAYILRWNHKSKFKYSKSSSYMVSNKPIPVSDIEVSDAIPHKKLRILCEAIEADRLARVYKKDDQFAKSTARGAIKALEKWKKAYLSEETQRQYIEFGPKAFKTRSQMTAIAKMPDFQIYCKPHDYISNNKILVRPDDSKHFADTRYFIANQQQEFMMRVDVSERGKIYGWVVYRRDHEHEKDSGVQMSWVIQKTGGEV